MYEYKVIEIKIYNKGLFSTKVTSETIFKIQTILNDIANDGWELVTVLPITNGQIPVHINQGLHYFKRKIQ